MHSTERPAEAGLVASFRLVSRAVSRSGRDGVLLGLLLIAILPFIAADRVLATDLPQHLAHAELARRGTQGPFVVDLTPRPYLLSTHLLLLLAPLGGLELAGRLALILYALGLVGGLRFVVDAAPTRDPRLAWIGPLFVQSWVVAYGFLPYLLGLPSVFFALGAARRLRTDARGGWVLAMVGAIVAALYAHPVTGVLAFVLAQTQLYDLPKHRRTPPLFLAAVAAGAFGLTSLWAAPPPGAVFETDLALQTWWRFSNKAKLLDYALAYLPGHLDLVAALPGALAIVTTFVLNRRRGERDPLDRAMVALGLLYGVAPSDLALGGLRVSLLGPRLVLPLWLLLVVGIRGPLPRLVPMFTGLSTAALALLLSLQARTFATELGPPLRQVLGGIPPGAVVQAKVTPLREPLLHPGLVGPVEGHLVQLAYLHGAAAVEGTFTTRQAPVWRTGRPVPTVVWVQTATATIELHTLPR